MLPSGLQLRFRLTNVRSGAGARAPNEMSRDTGCHSSFRRPLVSSRRLRVSARPPMTKHESAVLSTFHAGRDQETPTDLGSQEMFSATASRMSALNADSSTLSPSWKSIARLTLPSRLELKSFFGSFILAPFAKVTLTTVL